MGSKDSARTPQGVGSRRPSHEEPRTDGGMSESGRGHLHVSPRPAGVGCQDRLCDLRHPVEPDHLRVESRCPPEPVRSGHPAGGRHPRDIECFLVVREHLHDAAFAQGEQTVRRADARISLEHLRRRTRLPGALRAQPGQIAAHIPACGRTDGTTHQSPINIKK